MTFFDAYKEYLILNSKKEYIPTSAKFNEDALLDVVNKIDSAKYPFSQEDKDAICEFIEASKMLNCMHKKMYARIEELLPSFNMMGKNICQYFIAVINRNYHVLYKKQIENFKQAKKGTYPVMGLTEFRLVQDGQQLTPLPIQSGLEMSVDFTGVILNYLRYFLDTKFEQPDAHGNEFAGRLLSIDKLTNLGLLFRFIYNHTLYDGGRFKRLNKGSKLLHTYDNEDKEKLIKCGHILFDNKHQAVKYKYFSQTSQTRFSRLLRNCRIKSLRVENGCIKLSFGQGRVTDFNDTLIEFETSLIAYYKFLDINQQLTRLKDISIEEVLLVYGAMRYIARYVITHGHYDTQLYAQSDFDVIPSKIIRSDLINYVSKLLILPKKKIIECVKLFEADWGIMNNIWETPIYPIDNYELYPLYPIGFATIYYVIDRILERGGLPLDSRGPLFEKFIYEQLTNTPSPYDRICLPACKYGIKGDREEIDVLVALKYVILVGEAKCIQYPMEAINYHDAWKRLTEGAEQVARKIEFVKTHPEYFKALGDYSGKDFIPFVVTNYPIYTGCNHNGIYIVDASFFLSYLNGENRLTQRAVGEKDGEVKLISKLYSNEEEYSKNFEYCLRNNPLKGLILPHVQMEDCVIYKEKDVEWVSRSAQYMNDRELDIRVNVVK